MLISPDSTGLFQLVARLVIDGALQLPYSHSPGLSSRPRLSPWNDGGDVRVALDSTVPLGLSLSHLFLWARCPAPNLFQVRLPYSVRYLLDSTRLFFLKVSPAQNLPRSYFWRIHGLLGAA